MKIRKRLLVPLVLLAVLVLGGVGAFLYLDEIAARAMESAGTTALGVPTTVEAVRIRPFGGTARVDGVTVANPPGFETPHFMAVRETSVAFSLAELTGERVEVPSFVIEGMDVNLEQGRGGANYAPILEHLRSGGKPAGEGRKFVVKALAIRDVRVRAEVAVAGQKLTHVDLRIEEIRLEDVGSETKAGALLPELIGTIVKATLAAVVQQGARILPETLVNGLGLGLKGLGGTTVKVVGKVTATVGGKTFEIVGGAAKLVGKGAKEIVEGIGGLLGGGKEEDDE